MTRQELIHQIFTKKTFLCVGLDTDIKKIPEHLLKEEDPIFTFNKAIIDATAPYCVAYKPNLAFYESMGVKGWISFEKTITYLNENYPQHFIIADAKRGDIGNTSAMYARTFFEEINLDALTVAPYMGEDSVTPFLQYDGKWVILLALTSNKGSHDFQLTTDTEGERLFEKVLRKSQEWGNADNMMYVVGATQGKMFEDIRKIVQVRHDKGLRPHRQLLTRHHLCRQDRKVCRGGRRGSEKGGRTNGQAFKLTVKHKHQKLIAPLAPKEKYKK